MGSPKTRTDLTAWTFVSAVLLGTVPAAFLPLAAAAQERTPTRAAVLERDLADLVAWFAGRFDNDLQVYFDGEMDTPAEARNGRIHSIFAPVELPAFGAHVFYVEQYSDNDPSSIYRQRIYRFVVDEAKDAIRLEIFAPSPEQAAQMRGAYADPSKLAGLTPGAMTAFPGCEVYWRRQENQFIGSMQPDACRVASRRSGRTLLITDDLVLTPDAIWIRDVGRDAATGEWVYGNRAGVHHKLRKARAFTCWTAILRGAAHGDSGEGNDSWQFQRGGWLHDQGGELALVTDEPTPRRFRLRLRNVEWPYGSNRPSLTLYVHEEGNPRALSYAWADEGAQRVGINLRWLQASCTLDPAATFR
jgi:hypothetical protein